jgi:hypothetical protein
MSNPPYPPIWRFGEIPLKTPELPGNDQFLEKHPFFMFFASIRPKTEEMRQN